MVFMLMRRNGTQAAAAAHIHCTRPNGSRRWDPLRPLILRVLAAEFPISSRCSAATELRW